MASEKETMAGAAKQEEEEESPSEVDEDGVDVKSGEAGKGNMEEPEEDVNVEKDTEFKEESEEEADEAKGEHEEDEGDRTGEENEKKGSKRKTTSETIELKSPRTPGSERPTRERKMVDRFNMSETPRSSTSKSVSIQKGQGTQLKDIPNVAFKLSKRKADENLQLLHHILYGKKAKVHTLKRNVGRFSGFVWTENEEKQKAKTKEKIDKCTKEKLLDFCDILNISVSKASVKKEELVIKILEFLESPHATTDTLLADKEKGKKRKSKAPASKSPGSPHVTGVEKSAKKQKSDSDSGKKRKSLTEEEIDDESDHSDKDYEKSVPEGTNDVVEDEPKKQKLVEKVSSKKSSKKNVHKRSPPESSKAPGKSNRKVKSPSTKKQKVEKDTKGTSLTEKKAKSSTKVPENDQDDSESGEVKVPSREEMHGAVVDILKEVDFNTATLSDILKQLGKHFGVDLSHRKTEVKDIITDVIKNMSDDDDEDDEESGDESGKDEVDD